MFVSELIASQASDTIATTRNVECEAEHPGCPLPMAAGDEQ